MCTIFFAYTPDEETILTVAANRDEFLNRKTAPLNKWGDGSIGGKDLKAGGQWMACSTSGRFAALTNFRRPQSEKTFAHSRGELVSEFVNSKEDAEAFLCRIEKRCNDFDGFNLIVYDTESVWHYSNISQTKQKLSAGVYGVSNALLNTPWPKVVKGKVAFEQAISGYNVIEDCFDLLSNKHTYPESELPDTGIPKQLEKVLSACFVVTPGYGTRSSSVCKISQQHIYFEERQFGLMGRKLSTNHITHTLQK